MDKPPSTPQSDRLDSWKEISAYLRVTTRTAQNWERQGLPIHRPGNGRGTVVAYRSELDAWLHDESQDSPVQESRSPLKWPIVWRLLATLLAGFVTVALILVVRAQMKDRNPASAEIDSGRLVVFNKDGDFLWASGELLGRRGTGKLQADDGRLGQFLLMADVTGDGLSELFLSDSPDAPERRGHILAFRPDGKPLWPHPLLLGRPVQWGNRQFNVNHDTERPPLSFRYQGEAYLAVFGCHSTWFPSFVYAVRASDGEIVGEYWHPGRFTGVLLTDLDQDGNEEFILTGVNNPGPGAGHAFVSRLAVADLLTSRFDPEDPFGFQSSAIGDYLLFDNSDVAQARAIRNTTFNLLLLEPGEVRFGIQPGGFFGSVVPAFESIRFESSDEARRLHRELEITGQLDHSFSPEEIEKIQVLHFQHQNPNANSEEIRLRYLR